MSDLRNIDAVEKNAFLTSELDNFLRLVGNMAATSTDAVECVLLIHPRYTAPMESPATIPLESLVGQALLDFARDVNAEPHGATQMPNDDGHVAHLRRLRINAQDYAFFGVVLVDAHDVMMGTMTMAFAAEAWGSASLLTKALAAGRSASIMLETFGSKLALELDLLAVNKRVTRLQRLAQMDPLTGLENTASFEEKARERLAYDDQPCAFVLVDIDHFKTINDLYGHQFGDTYLKCIAGAISNAMPNSAIVGRLGGDEFGALIDVPRRGRVYLETLLSQCRSALQRATALLGKPDLGRVSIGVSFFPTQGDRYERLYELADTALYASKNSGRSLTTVYDREIHERYNNFELGKRFRAAVTANNILPVFQPVIDLDTGDCAGFEVLSRWLDPHRGLLEPDQFQAVFGNYRLAEQLTRTIVHQALGGFAEALDQTSFQFTHPVSLAFNLTSFDLMNREFVFDFQNAISDVGIHWSSIVIEVTETVMLGERNGQVFRSLEELRTRGAKVALDDFATGYGGLRHLRSWPVDILKIDRGFIANLSAEARDRAIVEAIVSISKTFGFEVIAEGVETIEQAKILREMECHYAQGFLFGRPMESSYLSETFQGFDLDAILSAHDMLIDA
ncbi:MAG: EAL domain-containing protein [Pseudomonadota bacterium]